MNIAALSEKENTELSPLHFRLGIFFLCALILVCTWFLWYLLQPENRPVKKIQVEVSSETGQISPQRLRNSILQYMQGGFFRSDIAGIRSELLQSPWIRDVRLQRIWPDTLKFFVVEQKAVARWGTHALLNEEAQIFVPDNIDSFLQLPQLSGLEGEEMHVLQQWRAWQQYLQNIGFTITQLSMDQRYSWSLELDTGVSVNLGRTDVDDRLQKFVDLLQVDFLSQFMPPVQIDFRYPNGFSVNRHIN